MTFQCEFSLDLPPAVHADEKRLRQVLINLLGNAIKFTEKGCITLKVSLNEKTINSQTPNEQAANEPSRRFYSLLFQIEDTGVGMAPAQLEKIFLPFEQVGNTDKKASGTGLGLAISQRIAEMMNSPLQVTSKVGEGSVFWLSPKI